MKNIRIVMKMKTCLTKWTMRMRTTSWRITTWAHPMHLFVIRYGNYLDEIGKRMFHQVLTYVQLYGT